MPVSFDDFGQPMVELMRDEMSSMMAAAQLLMPAIHHLESETYNQYFAMMSQSMYRLLRLVNNVDFAAVAPEEPLILQGPLDLAGLCREMSAQIAPLAEETGVSFRYEENCASLLTTGNAELLRRMLLNLIANAIRAAGKDGMAGLRLNADGGRAVLTVWDNGAGIAPPPSAEADPLTRTLHGLGLGLEVARKAAILHGGVLIFDQQENRGGRATVSLPLRPPEAGSSLRSPADRYNGTGGFFPVLLELSGVLPFDPFLPQNLE